ncbi:MAG: IS1595 family transposase [Verrucomicrobiota bacterium]
MTMRNRYFRRSRVSAAKFRLLLRLFCLDMEATKVAQLTGLNRNWVNQYFQHFRRRLAQLCEAESPLRGEVEIDESYFGGRRVRGKRGRGAFKKVPVLGLLKRNGKVYTQVVPNCSRAVLTAILKGKVALGSVIYSDGSKGYSGLVDLGYKKHHRVDQGRNEFVKHKAHINGIENFWGLAKMRLAKFRGLNRATLYLHLQECEFRFNHRRDNLYQLLLNNFKINPLN